MAVEFKSAISSQVVGADLEQLFPVGVIAPVDFLIVVVLGIPIKEELPFIKDSTLGSNSYFSYWEHPYSSYFFNSYFVYPY